MTSLEDREKQNAKQKSVILKVDVVHDQEAGMQEERCGYESLDVGIWCSTDKPDKKRSALGQQVICYAQGPVPPYFSRTAARTNSVRMTVVLWYAMTLQAE